MLHARGRESAGAEIFKLESWRAFRRISDLRAALFIIGAKNGTLVQCYADLYENLTLSSWKDLVKLQALCRVLHKIHLNDISRRYFYKLK
ncbi:hypothetical protein DCC62_27145 [candidate division KSB1 bacterium]|nr:MAG: hypothetical protein DCC62_27145 [candidate division KSB1 bacterium]